MADHIKVDELVSSIHFYSGKANGYEWSTTVTNDGNNWWVEGEFEWDDSTPFSNREFNRLEKRIISALKALHKYELGQWKLLEGEKHDVES